MEVAALRRARECRLESRAAMPAPSALCVAPFVYGGGSIGDGIAGSVSGFSGGGAYGGDASIGLFANVPFPFSVFGGYSYT